MHFIVPSQNRNKRATYRYIFVVCILLTALLLPALPAYAAGSIHVVQPGESLSGIAARYGLTIHQLQQWNHINNPNLIYVGQRLRITATSSPAQQRRYYTVRRGDTLGKIAAKFGMTVAALANYNNIKNTDFIYVGLRLRIPVGAPQAAPTTGPAVSSYIVQAGDTLSGIAFRFNSTISAIAYANRLSDVNHIYPGQRLRIPRSANVYNGPKKFVVSLSRQHCWLYSGNTLLYSWRCSTGRSGWRTRTGTFSVQNKLPRAYGSSWNIWMPYWLGIYWAGSSQNGIHGLPWNATTGGQTWAGYVGVPITYGCIMLDNYAAKTLYRLAYIGMPVIIRP